MRLTRAALRAEALPLDAHFPDASPPHLDLKDRIPLGEVSLNAAIEPDFQDPPSKDMPAKKTNAKGAAKKATQGPKAKAPDTTDNPPLDVLEHHPHPASSPVSDAAVDDRATNDDAHVDQAPLNLNHQPPPSPPSRPVRMTRRQLAKQEEDLSNSLHLCPSPQSDLGLAHAQDTTPGAQEASITKAQQDPHIEEKDPTVDESPAPDIVSSSATEIQTERAPAGNVQDVIAPSVQVTSEPEPKTLTSEKPCEQATPATSQTPSRASSRSHSESPAKSPMRLEESIEAIDALEEALENVGKAFPIFDQSADESSKKGAISKSAASKAQGRMAKKSPLASKASRTPSLAPTSLKPTIRSSVARSSSVRAPFKEARKGSGEVSDYLASKRRPISMSFPTPAPPSRSTKAPTKATFHLPGEAVAAKLKAQKEERLKREAEGGPAKPRPISLPPPPKSTKAPTRPNFQLPGEAIAAKLKAQKEERLRREAEGRAPAARPISMRPPPKSSKPPTVANFQLPGEAIAAKLKVQREERLQREGAAGLAKKPAFKARPAPVRKAGPAPVRQTAASKARESLMGSENVQSLGIPPGLQRSGSVNAIKRGSIALGRTVSTSSATSSKRNSVMLNPGPITKSAVTPADAAALKIKGRTVFNRDRMEKEAREQERREKEEAAKRARAEAAERGRIASREWAEKQKKKMVVAHAAPTAEGA